MASGVFIPLEFTASIAQAQAQMQQLNQSLASMKTTAASVNTGFTGLNNTFGRFTNNLQSANSPLLNTIKNLNGLQAVLLFMAGGTLVRTGVGFAQLAGEMEQTRIRIQALEGSVEKTNGVMRELFSIAQRSPFTIKSMSDAFVKLKTAGIDEPIQAIQTLSDSIAAFGGTNDQFERAILAISQMAGKGVISLEELRQQLGEAVPTALRAMAAGLNISVPKLIDEISKGNVEFKRGFEAMMKELQSAYGGAGATLSQTLIGAFQRVRSSIETVADSISTGGGLTGFTAVLEAVNSRVQEFNNYLNSPEGREGLKNFSESIAKIADYVGQMGTSLGPVIGFLKQMGAEFGAILAYLPPEAVSFGIVGYVLFGRLGAAAGAFIGWVAGINNETVSSLRSMIQQIYSAVNQYVDVAGIGTWGLIGFLLFGPVGAAAGAAAGLLAQYKTEILSFFGFVQEAGASAATGAASIKSDRTPSIVGQAAAGTGGTAPEIEAATRAVNGLRSQLNAVAAGTDNVKSRVSQAFDVIANKAETTSTTVKSRMDDAFGAFGDSKATDSVVQKNEQLTAALQKRANIQYKLTSGIDDLNSQEIKSLEKLRASYDSVTESIQSGGNAWRSYKVDLQQTLEGYDKLIAGVQSRLETNMATATDANDQKNIQNLQNSIKALQEQRASISTMIQNIGPQVEAAESAPITRIEQGLNRVKTQLNGIQNNAPGASALNEAMTQAADKVEQYRLALTKYREDVLRANIPEADRARLLREVDSQLSRIPAAQAQATAAAQQDIQVQQQQNALLRDKAVENARYQLQLMQAKVAGNETTQAQLQAQNEVRTQLNQILAEIVQIQQASAKGLITPEAAQASITNLRTIYSQMQTVGQQYVQQQTFLASNWGKMWTSIASSVESGFTDALTGLITGTQTAQQALLNMYNAITRAVVNYLVRQAMVGMFGGNTASGMSSIFTPFGSGGLFGGMMGFASGGSFMVGGTSGTDRVPVGFMASRGEKVSVETRAQQSRLGSDGGGYNINISAVDAQSVRDLFYREGGALVEAIAQRERMNRGRR